jgi:hypothetical protein
MLAAVLALAGCKAEEQGRQVKLDKGSYAGFRDGEITPATRQALTTRQARQSDGVARLTAEGPIPTGEAAPAGRIAGQNY